MKQKFMPLLSVLLILATLPLTAGAASPTQVWVDASWAMLDSGNTVIVDGETKTIDTDAFSSIQDAINEVAANGAIFVATGTYDEQLSISKNVTIIGSGENTIVQPQDPSEVTWEEESSTPIVYISGTASVTLKNLALDPAGHGADMGIFLYQSGGTIENIKITDTDFGIVASSNVGSRHVIIKDCQLTNVGFGILLISDHDGEMTATVEGNSIEGSDKISVFGITAIINQVDIIGNSVYTFWAGICVIDTPVARVINNTVSSCRDGINLQKCEDIEISGNTITGNETGIYVNMAIGQFTGNLFDGNDVGISINPDHSESAYSSTLEIIGNWFTDNEFGIELPHEITDMLDRLVFAFNGFDGNTEFGLFNESTSEFCIARLNWWGHPEGPTPCDDAGPALGDIIGPNTYYDPWLAGLSLTATANSPVVATATLLDSDNQTAANDVLTVRFTVSGANNLTRDVPMVNGVAVLNYDGLEGTDTITAELLIAGQQTGASSELQIPIEVKHHAITSDPASLSFTTGQTASGMLRIADYSSGSKLNDIIYDKSPELTVQFQIPPSAEPDSEGYLDIPYTVECAIPGSYSITITEITIDEYSYPASPELQIPVEVRHSPELPVTSGRNPWLVLGLVIILLGVALTALVRKPGLN